MSRRIGISYHLTLGKVHQPLKGSRAVLRIPSNYFGEHQLFTPPFLRIGQMGQVAARNETKMRFPVIQGKIERRLLVNYRVDPEVLSKLLPNPFQPQIVHGYGIAGICLIRLIEIRPRFLPPVIGIGSENAAHRIAVEWQQADGVQSGVYIPRRDTSSRLNALLGGRLFPGIHHRARFRSEEQQGHFCVQVASCDDGTQIQVEGAVVDTTPQNSVFRTTQEAVQFFRNGSLGYSSTSRPDKFDGLELRTLNWDMEPLHVEKVESSYFGDSKLFPYGSVEFDSAFLMRNIEHEWHDIGNLCAEE